jgi:gamma-glutamylcyclotransferase (GGCT)/AIG2-like uncharacterized protein YtfP
MKNIFAYGTLQVPSVQKELLGRSFNSLGVTTLNDFVVMNDYFVEDGHYPRLAPMKGGVVYGNVYSMSDKDIAVLDDYETDAYELKQVNASCGTSVYVYFPKTK